MMTDWNAYRREYNKHYRRENREYLKAYNTRRLAGYRKDWISYFKTKYGSTPQCQLCEKTLYWTHKHHGKRACFDHRRGDEPIQNKSPRTWIQNKVFTDKHVATFEACDFGILCRACNLLLPGDMKKRAAMVCNLEKYLS